MGKHAGYFEGMILSICDMIMIHHIDDEQRMEICLCVYIMNYYFKA